MADKPALTIDVEANRIRQYVMSLYHNVLRDYIAHANEQDVLEKLHEFYTHSEIAIIHKQQLKQYQEMEKTILSHSLLAPNNGLFPNG